MAFPPLPRLDPRHESPGNIPDCQIILSIRCQPGDCAAGGMIVRVIRAADGATLAEGPVVCDGTRRNHVFEMLESNPERAERIRVICICGATEATVLEELAFLRCV